MSCTAHARIFRACTHSAFVTLPVLVVVSGTRKQGSNGRSLTKDMNSLTIYKDNVKVIKGLEKTFYGATEFSIQDNNGYLLTFAEDEK
jgi:hypothetical protein